MLDKDFAEETSAVRAATLRMTDIVSELGLIHCTQFAAYGKSEKGYRSFASPRAVDVCFNPHAGGMAGSLA